MKKTICIILACFLLVMTPIKGYASSAPLVFGIGEEVILPFLLSLLGVQAVNQIDSYDDLVSFNDEVYGSLIESLSGLAGFETIQAWLLKAVQGTIETDSIIWQKLRELAISNFVSHESNVINGNYNGQLGNFDFSFLQGSNLSGVNSVDANITSIVNAQAIIRVASDQWLLADSVRNDIYTTTRIISSGKVTTWRPSSIQSYTFDGQTVYAYTYQSSQMVYSPELSVNSIANADYMKVAWLSIYNEFEVPSENIAEYSGAFGLALSAQQKEDIIDGTSVIQLYNPADEQNGLHFVPDPEEPDDIKIPFAVTADWWNYLKQFGNDAKEQVVQAYNALNGLSGNSIGSISDAYDKLGIASVLSSAQSAAEGIASLTDSNVYPNSLTVADAINNSIPSSLTPQTPDDGIDNESEQGLYKLPDLRDYFPFCIPFDLIDLLSCFVAEPETPSFVIALSNGEETVSGNMDLHIWDNIAGVIRTFELIGFTVGLILITRNIIRG